MSHVHVHVSYGNWVNRIVLAPVMHNLHHSIELPHRDKNYGVILTVWDWMFGTLYLPKKNETWRWGLNEVEFGEKILTKPCEVSISSHSFRSGRVCFKSALARMP